MSIAAFYHKRKVLLKRIFWFLLGNVLYLATVFLVVMMLISISEGVGPVDLKAIKKELEFTLVQVLPFPFNVFFPFRDFLSLLKVDIPLNMLLWNIGALVWLIRKDRRKRRAAEITA